MRPLEGIRVLDATRLLPGALATKQLAEWGASVIKIEQPGTGDYARNLLLSGDGESPVFTATNRGKRSAAIDLKTTCGRDALIALVRTAGVLIESFRPGVMDKLGLGWDVLRQANPQLIYVALTGYGQSGPLSAAAGHDINYLAVAGVLDLIGERGCGPAVPGVQIADVVGGGIDAATAVLAAVLERQRTGQGQFVDVSMTRGARALLALPLALYRATGHAPSRGEGVLGGGYACYNVYRCRDRRWIALGALEPKFWAALCAALQRPDLVACQYAAEPHQSALKHELSVIFESRTAAEWEHALRDHDCCVTQVRTVAESDDEEWREPQSDAAPALGQHTREVLLEAGLTETEIDQCATGA